MNIRLLVVAASLASAGSSGARIPDPAALQSARLDHAAALDGPLDRPARLARLCLDARLACGFELRAGVWKRPESKRRIPSATVGQALKIFMGQDYVLTWRDGVLLMTPAAPDAAFPLDARVSADTREESPVSSGESLRAVALGARLRLKASGKPTLRRDPPGRAASNPTEASARSTLALLDRPTQDHPNSWIAVYAKDVRSGSLFWYWGDNR